MTIKQKKKLAIGLYPNLKFILKKIPFKTFNNHTKRKY